MQNIANFIVIAEDISKPIDEGVKKFSSEFFSYAKQFRNACLFARYKPNGLGIIDLPKNKLFLSNKLFHEIGRIKPVHIIYIPASSTTFFSFLRLKIVSFYSWKSRKTIISLQQRKHNNFEKIIIKFCKPDLLISFSKKELEYYKRLGITTLLSSGGVDTKKYLPVNKSTKNALRVKYKIQQEAKLALHVGHIKSQRNIIMLAGLIKLGYQVLIVGSTSTSTDEVLKAQLEKKGCIVFNHFIESIEEIYQISDFYVFPVLSGTAAIEFPLSVLEAMSCNIPVFATHFGALSTYFAETEGISFFETKNEMIEKIKAYNFELECKNRDIIMKDFTWNKIFEKIITISERE